MRTVGKLGYGGKVTFDADNTTFNLSIKNFAAADAVNLASFQAITDANKRMSDQMAAMQAQVAELSTALAAAWMGTTQPPPPPQYLAPMTTLAPVTSPSTVYTPPQPPTYHPPSPTHPIPTTTTAMTAASTGRPTKLAAATAIFLPSPTTQRQVPRWTRERRQIKRRPIRARTTETREEVLTRVYISARAASLCPKSRKFCITPPILSSALQIGIIVTHTGATSSTGTPQQCAQKLILVMCGQQREIIVVVAATRPTTIMLSHLLIDG